MQRILSYMRKAIEDYNMIEENDKIDTQEGINDLDYSFDIVVTGTQVAP